MVCFLEVTINLDRFNLMYSNTSVFEKIPLKYLILICVLFHVTLSIPDIISHEILYLEQYQKYTYSLSTFGKSKYYNLHVIIYAGSYYLMILLSLIYLNYKNIVKYRELVKYAASRSRAHQKKFFKGERKFTRMIIITTFLCLYVLIVSIVAIAFTRIYYLQGIFYDPLVNIIRGFYYLMMTLYCMTDQLIYLYIDDKLRKIIINYLMEE